MTPPEFSRPVTVDDLEAGPRTYQLKATPEELAALARRFDLRSLDRLEARVRAQAMGRSVIRLDGHLSALATQSCVVTLEPISAGIEADFQEAFAEETWLDDDPDQEIDLTGPDEEFPEPLVDGAVDMGEVVAEHLALNLDPYPRKPGAEFDGLTTNQETGKDTPFAVLAKLRSRAT